MKRETRSVILLALMLAVVYLTLASATTLWDRDEPRFARAAVEMVETGNYLVPHFNNEYRLHKPALIYWCMAPFVWLFGPTTLAVRLPSILAMVANAVMVYHIGRRMFDHATARRAMLIFGTAALPVYIGTAAMSDSVLNLSITVAIFTFIDAAYRRFRWWQPMALALALGAAQLTKGPVGLAVPLLMFITVAVFGRRQIKVGRAWWAGCVAAVLAGTGLFLAWAIPANIATDGQFAAEGLGRHVGQRMTSAMEGHGGSNLLEYIATIPLYLPLLIAGFFPWIIHLPAAVRAIIGRRLAGPRERILLVCWALPTFALMSLIATKLPHYILPIYPSLALAASAAVTQSLADQLSEKDRDWLRGGIWFFAPVAALVTGALIAAPFLIGHPGLLGVMIVPALVVALLGVFAIRRQLAESVEATNRWLAVGTPAFFILTSLAALPSLDAALKPGPALAETVHAQIADDEPVYVMGYDEPSLMFYMNRPAELPITHMTADQVEQWAKSHGTGALIITSENLQRLIESRGPMPLRKIGSHDVVNYSAGGKRAQVLAMVTAPQSATPD
jgi:4-amino-4-deoxy-L-arabinose transferase-like glycosyltransferase